MGTGWTGLISHRAHPAAKGAEDMAQAAQDGPGHWLAAVRSLAGYVHEGRLPREALGQQVRHGRRIHKAQQLVQRLPQRLPVLPGTRSAGGHAGQHLQCICSAEHDVWSNGNSHRHSLLSAAMHVQQSLRPTSQLSVCSSLIQRCRRPLMQSTSSWSAKRPRLATSRPTCRPGIVVSTA